MPATQYSGYGFNGMGLPQLDLLWDTAFGLRFGLFTSAPLLLVALYPAAWLRESIRLVGRVEAGTIAVFVICLFLFCSANEYGRLQFNSGVRYIVPAVPFLFLLGAGVLLRLPTVVAALIGIGGVYWSWCLAMYRDVEQGWGVLESLIHITTGGPRLPWLMTLERMGYGAGQVMLPLLLVCAIIVWWLWIGTRLGAGRRTAY
jgi:hypothetical protein